MKVALVCIAKNEDFYIKEWVDYHIKLGFHKIFIYENEWRCNVDFDSNSIVKIPFDGKSQQMNVYQNFINHYSVEYNWVAFFDVDEFLVLKKHNSVSDLILEFKNETCLAVNWVFFGDNNLKNVTDNNYSVLSRFTKRQIGVDRHIKSIINLKNHVKIQNPHNPHKIRWTDPSGNRNFGPFNDNGNDIVYQLNHYYTKTKDEFIQKVNRGRADNGSFKKVEEYKHYNSYCNDIEDLTALNFFKK